MQQNDIINKDLAVKLCNSIELVYNTAAELKSVKMADYEPIMEHFEIVGEFFKVNDKLGVLLLCYFVNRRLVKGKAFVTLNELMNAFECSLVDSISINEQLEYFRKAKILVSSKKSYGKKEDIEYSLCAATLSSVLKGDPDILNVKKELTFSAFLNLFHGIIYDNELDDEDASVEIGVLMEEFENLEEIKFLKAERLVSEELAIYLFIVARQTIFGDTKVSMERVFRVAVNDNFSKYYYQNEILERRSPLLLNDLIQFAPDSFMDFLQLTEKSVKTLNVVEKKSTRQFTTGSDLVTLIMPDKIKFQEGMVYEESLKIDFLDQLISEDGYIKAIKKLEEEKVETKQIVALLYGVSGLGKSQTIRNLAAKYNRPILQVNLSQVKDAFVGNTEKNTQEVFNIYRKAVNHFQYTKNIDGEDVGPFGTPLLYLDEFDSLIPHRKSNGSDSSVGNMYSNMVGIFLTELEKVNGIVLLASNLPGAIDTSLHRRINFKFHFGTFSKKNQIRTLQLYFKDFEPQMLEEVASDVELTPGNIVNIRKAFVLESIFKEFNSEEDKKTLLSDLVNRELILKKSNRNPIGFTYKNN
jgi:SpoVK/Ycf46/Vps4 family AAA+-type ATPase